ncbi:MAG: glycosyltransferase [Acidobacteriota bacterium]
MTAPPAKPAVSVILPTLDEGRRLGRCLASIRRQDYPQDRVEILVADGGSTDGTVEIAGRYGCRLVDARGLLAEAAKGKALALAQGDLVAMVDADNTIVGTDWLALAARALGAHPDALGFESYYALDASDPALNRYLTGLLQISDPWARAVARRPRRLRVEPGGVEVFELPRDGAYPTGANGFLFPRRHLLDLGDRPFHEATFFPQLIRAGRRRLLKHPGARVHHDYVRGWGDYFRKKQRVALHYLLRRK